MSETEQKPQSKKRQAYIEALADPDLCTLSDTDISKLIGVSRGSMIKYKNEQGFWQEVKDLRLQVMRKKAGHVIDAVYKGATNNSNPGAAAKQKLFLTMTGDYVDKQEIDLGGKIEVDHKIDLKDPEQLREAVLKMGSK